MTVYSNKNVSSSTKFHAARVDRSLDFLVRPNERFLVFCESKELKAAELWHVIPFVQEHMGNSSS